jgi:hypothetical protein
MGKTESPVNAGASSRTAVPSASLTTETTLTVLNQHLLEITEVIYDPSRKAYLVTTPEGLVAVSLDQPHSLTAGPGISDEALRAAYATALGEQAVLAPLDAPDHILELGELRNQMTDMDPNSPEYAAAMSRFTELAQQAMESDLSVCHEEPAEIPASGPISRRVAAKRRAEQLGSQLRDFVRGQNRQEASAAQALFYGTDEDGEVMIPTDKFEESRQAAIALGGEHLIPEVKIDLEAKEKLDENGNPILDSEGNPVMEIDSVGEVHANQHFMDAMELFESRVKDGGVRLVILSGPPSTGKDTFAEQMAGVMGMPLTTRNMGPRYDISDALGGEGLGPVNTYDEEGNLTGTVMGSKRIVGSLSEAAQHRCAYVMTEIEGMEDDLVRLNTLFGSRVGEPEKRTVSAGSISDDDEIVPNEDFIVFITYNPGENDIKLPSSVANRALNISFEYAPLEEESKIVAKMASKVMERQEAMPKLQREVEAEEIAPVVKLVRRLRDLHLTNPETFKDMPDMRQAAHIYHDLLYLGAVGHPDPISAVSKTLDHLLPGSMSMEMSPSEREARLADAIKDYENELNAIVQLGYSQRVEGS